MSEVEQFNRSNDPNSSDYKPGAYTFDQFVEKTRFSDTFFTSPIDYTVPTSGSVIAQAVIQAAGSVTVNATKEINNSVIRPNATDIDTPVANRNTNSDVFASTVKPAITAQLPPDLAQRQVNPVTLPGFSLPTGENGLFRLSGQAAKAGAAGKADTAKGDFNANGRVITAADRENPRLQRRARARLQPRRPTGQWRGQRPRPVGLGQPRPIGHPRTRPAGHRSGRQQPQIPDRNQPGAHRPQAVHELRLPARQTGLQPRHQLEAPGRRPVRAAPDPRSRGGPHRPTLHQRPRQRRRTVPLPDGQRHLVQGLAQPATGRVANCRASRGTDPRHRVDGRSRDQRPESPHPVLYLAQANNRLAPTAR